MQIKWTLPGRRLLAHEWKTPLGLISVNGDSAPFQAILKKFPQ